MQKPQRAARLDKLADIASIQEGFFSAVQAAEKGVDRFALQRLVQAGLLARGPRAVYRFASYPPTDRGELWEATLWPSVGKIQRDNRRLFGVLSHGSALELHAVSTINPSTIDLTLPRYYRVRRAAPSLYRLHFADLPPTDVVKTEQGLPITTLYRTLLDLIAERSQLQFVDEALERAKTLTGSEIQKLRALRTLDDDTVLHVRQSRARR